MSPYGWLASPGCNELMIRMESGPLNRSVMWDGIPWDFFVMNLQNRACHPGGQNRDYYTGTLSYMYSSHWYSLEDLVSSISTWFSNVQKFTKKLIQFKWINNYCIKIYSTWNNNTCLSYIANTIPADALVTLGASASAGMVQTPKSQNIPSPASEESTHSFHIEK